MSEKKKKKILIVDDSSLMRTILRDIIEEDNDLEVVDTAKNGREAMTKIDSLHPDLITIDIEMPILDGLSTIKLVMKKSPKRFLVISAFTKKDSAATIKAIEYGAIDFIQKPAGTISPNISTIKQEILRKVNEVLDIPIEKVKQLMEMKGSVKKVDKRRMTDSKIVIIGASTGGPKAIEVLLSQLPDNLKGSIFVVQHMPPTFTSSFAERLNELTTLTVLESEDGLPVKDGHVYVARGNHHMVVNLNEKKEVVIKLNQDPQIWGVRPAIDVSMDSIASIYKESTLGIILTGMGHDGTHGLRMIKENGGVTIAQDRTTSLIFGMPYSAIKENVVDQVVPLFDISQKIINFFYLVSGPPTALD